MCITNSKKIRILFASRQKIKVSPNSSISISDRKKNCIYYLSFNIRKERALFDIFRLNCSTLIQYSMSLVGSLSFDRVENRIFPKEYDFFLIVRGSMESTVADPGGVSLSRGPL